MGEYPGTKAGSSPSCFLSGVHNQGKNLPRSGKQTKQNPSQIFDTSNDLKKYNLLFFFPFKNEKSK